MQAHTDIPSVMSSKTLGTISVAIVIQNNITQFLMAILHFKVTLCRQAAGGTPTLPVASASPT